MALRGTTPGATYDDIVHVNQSGAGLPDHAGGEAALYVDDGAGGVDQILGRTAVRHWLDPHPDAASFNETFEFSTYGDANQAALEADGWTFVNCTAAVSNGVMWLTASSTAIVSAYVSTTLAGDFDICAHVITDMSYGATTDGTASYTLIGGPMVVDTTNDVLHGIVAVGLGGTDGKIQITRYNGTTYSTMAGGSAALISPEAISNYILRVSRVSGTVYTSAACNWNTVRLVSDDTGLANNGFDSSNVADADTMQGAGIMVSNAALASGSKVGVLFLRRFQ